MLLALSFAAAASCWPLASAKAGWVGDTVHVEYLFPTTANAQNFGSFVVPGGATFFGGDMSYSATATQITVTGGSGGEDFTATGATFNGLRFTDTSGAPNITGVTLDVASTANGASNASASFTSNSLSLNFENQVWDPNQSAIFDVTFASPVPEPMSLALFGVGLVGFGLSRRRRG